jgi:hypothetical protein
MQLQIVFSHRTFPARIRIISVQQKGIYAIWQPPFRPYWRFKASISIQRVILLLTGFHTIGKASFRAETRRSKAAQSTAGSGSSRTGTFRLSQVVEYE